MKAFGEVLYSCDEGGLHIALAIWESPHRMEAED